MFSTGDDIVLERLERKRGEEGGIARDTHSPDRGTDPMFSLPAAFRGNDVVLNMPAFMHLEEGAQQDHQFLLVRFVLQRCWIQFLVEQHAAENRGRRQFTHRANDRSRAEMVRYRRPD